ncbi:MAG: metallophosphoesterase [Spirochaetaceae bacterium]
MSTDDLSTTILNGLYESSEKRRLRPGERYVVASDLHMGNGGRADDFKRNAELFTTVMREHYLRHGYRLVLNGDIEELHRFRLDAVRRRWAAVYEVFAAFQEQTELHRLAGNHDLELLENPPEDFAVGESLRLDYHGEDIFIFHGHQATLRILKNATLVGFVLRYIATPLGLRNRAAAHDSKRRYRTERRVYRFASARKILAVIGHTHRPLFESMSKVDTVRFEIEQLIRTYPKASEKKKRWIESEVESYKDDLARLQPQDGSLGVGVRESLYNESLVVPTVFNSGCAIGKRGITVLELDGDGHLSLVHWFDRRRSQKYLKTGIYEPTRLEDTDYYRVEMASDTLEHIMTRVKLLA